MGAFYQSEVTTLFSSGIPEGIVVPNVQSISTAFSAERQNVMRLGKFAPAKRRPTLQQPTVTVNMDFIPTGADIFHALGMMNTNGVLNDLASGNNTMYDCKIQMRDLMGAQNAFGTLNLTSGVMTNFSFQSSVGQTPRSSVSIEFLDLGVDATSRFVPPNISENVVVGPQDIIINLPRHTFGIESLYLQSVSMTIPIPRSEIRRLGSLTPEKRNIQAPIVATFQVQAIIDSFENTSNINGNTDEMNKLICGTPIDDDISIRLRRPNCSGVDIGASLILFILKKPYLDSINFSNQVAGHTSVDMQFSCLATMESYPDESNIVFFA